MKKVVSINLGNYGSTGRIMLGISLLAQAFGYETYQAYPKSRNIQSEIKNDIIICSTFWNRLNQKLAYITGLNGCFAPIATRNFLTKLHGIKPDIIHLHNLHNSYINLPMLFNYIRNNNIKVVWTLHDCWSFTGHCPHFTLIGCERWKYGCGKCQQLNIYPPAMYDKTHYMWLKKKKWFSNIKNLTIVTPSIWLSKLVKQSFLSEYPVRVINNGIDLDVFKPLNSSFRIIHGIVKETMILGVAFDWGERKGLDVFNYLAKHLDDSFKIVLVGTDETIDKLLSKRILSIHRTHSLTELAEIYSAADIFVNPTREDNFPTVNMEALACGTPVITFDTGGSPEIIDSSCGSVVPCNNNKALLEEILNICKNKTYNKNSCIIRAKNFKCTDKYLEYVHLYGEL